MKKYRFNGRDYTCPFSDLLPPLTAKVRADLKADITRNDITYPIVVSDIGEIIDGLNRVEIAAELGLTDIAVNVLSGLTAEEKHDLAVSLNIHRRHLTADQIRGVIARRLTADPARSDRQVATAVGVDHKTVGAVRKGLVKCGEIPHTTATRGSDGILRRVAKRRTTSPRDVVAVPAEVNRTTVAAEAVVPQAAAYVAPPPGTARKSELTLLGAEFYQIGKRIKSASRKNSQDFDLDEVGEIADSASELVKRVRIWRQQFATGSTAPSFALTAGQA